MALKRVFMKELNESQSSLVSGGITSTAFSFDIGNVIFGVGGIFFIAGAATVLAIVGAYYYLSKDS